MYYEGKTEIPALQALKCICAFLVVVHHVEPPYISLVAPLARTTVPVFFMITGYFLVGPDARINTSKIPRTLRKIFNMALSANVAYFLFLLAYNLILFGDISRLDYIFTPESLFNLVVFGTTLCGPLWYLNAVFFALIIIFLLVRARLDRLLLPLVVLGILANLVLGQYAFFCHLPDAGYFLNRNALTIGLPCIMIGTYIRLGESRLRAFRHWPAVVAALIVLLYAEAFFLGRTLPHWYSGDTAIITVPAAAGIYTLFLTGSHNILPGRNILRRPRLNRLLHRLLSLVSEIGRRYTMPIYVYHYMMILVMDVTLFPLLHYRSPLLVFLLLLAILALPQRLGKGNLPQRR